MILDIFFKYRSLKYISCLEPPTEDSVEIYLHDISEQKKDTRDESNVIIFAYSLCKPIE